MKINFLVLALGLMVANVNAQRVSIRLDFPVGTHVQAYGPRPYSNAIWIGPEWQWRGNHYVSVPGYWAKPSRHGAIWVQGHWQYSRRGYRWVPGHWR
jgi:hypothetical protein